MGVTSLFGLVGCAKAQIGKLVFNLDNPDYGLNVAAMMSSLLDTTQQKIEARYKVDTLKFYNTETDEPFPPLVAYRNKGGSKRTEATFRGFDFTELGMVTTEQGTLVQVKGKKNTDEEGFAKLVKAATKKYGKPHFEEGIDFEGRPGHIIVVSHSTGKVGTNGTDIIIFKNNRKREETLTRYAYCFCIHVHCSLYA